MCDYIQIYKFSHSTILQPFFYEISRINPLYNRRRLFRFVNGAICFNSYFPMLTAESVLNFQCIYAYYSSTLAIETADCDFDIGFNNCDLDVERLIAQDAVQKFDSYLILKFDSESPKRYCALLASGVYSCNSDNVFVVRLTQENLQTLFGELHMYIRGYLFNPLHGYDSFTNFSYSAIDLSSLQKMVDNFQFAMLRVPIFSNYNFMVLTKRNDDVEQMWNHISSLLRDTGISVIQHLEL